MPRKSILIFLTVGLLSFVIAISWQKTPISLFKNASLKPSRQILIRTSKLLPPFEVALSKRDNGPAMVGERFTLDALITTTKSLDVLEYKWILPVGVQITGDQLLRGQISQISPRQPAQISAEFISSSEVNEKIHLEVWVPGQASPLAQTAQFNTLDQEQLDRERKALAERNNEYISNQTEEIKTFK